MTDSSIILYGRNSAGQIQALNIAGSGQNQAIVNYISKVRTAEDVNMSSTTTGAQLIYNSSTSKWDNRIKDYATVSISGALLALAANTKYQLPISGGASQAWTTLSDRRSSINGIVWSGNSFSNVNSARTYRVDASFGVSSINIGTADTIIAMDLINQSGTTLGQAQLTYNADGSFGSGMSFSYIGSGNTSFALRVSSNFALGTPFSGTVNPCASFSVSIVEL